MEKVKFDELGNPVNTTCARILYELASEDGANTLLLDAVTHDEILADSDGVCAVFDALITPYAQLQRKMNVFNAVLERAGTTLKPVAMTISDPFKRLGVTNIAVIFELSDGQTISVLFHNPDTTPNKLKPTDEMISWKWMLNKKDVTILCAPEHGQDLNVREVARRLIKLAEKNSAAFARANEKRAERMKAIAASESEIAELEKELKGLQKQIEAQNIEIEDKTAERDEAKRDFNNRVGQALVASAKAEEEKRKAEEEAARLAAEEAEKKAREEAERKAKEAAEAERRAAEEAARLKAEEDAKRAQAASMPTDDAQIAADKGVLQSIINKTHPDIHSGKLAREVLRPILKRYEGTNSEMAEMVDKAIDAYAEVAEQDTRNL